MTLTNNTEPESEGKSKLHIAIDALMACCLILQLPFHIKHSHKKYGIHLNSCTVIVGNKSFTHRGEDCMTEALKQACHYLIRTYTALSQFREQLENKLATENKLGECVAEFVKYTPPESTVF